MWLGMTRFAFKKTMIFENFHIPITWSIAWDVNHREKLGNLCRRAVRMIDPLLRGLKPIQDKSQTLGFSRSHDRPVTKGIETG